MNSPQDSAPSSPDKTHEGLPSIAPDFVEQDWPEQIDNIVPTRGYQMTPMVGLGGSAGSIQALTKFFKAMPANSGMVFVVIMHLSPTRESTIADLLGRSTSMPVVQAEDGRKVEPDHVYVIPPGKFLATVNGHLRLFRLESERGKRVAVDLFFRSLADTHGPHAMAVVLSGADGDGALGVKRVKERGGLTIAQDPDEAEHAGMPRASINTGMVDWVLSVAEIPKRLLEYRDHEERLRLPPEEGPPPALPQPTPGDSEAALRDVLVFLRMRTGRDFSYYKRATILRRIARRMQVNSVEDLPAYLAYLRTHPGESGALLQDLLISVTNLFRDRDAFLALKQRIPQLFKDKTQTDTVRVWVPACATGDEAYCMAMLLLEHAQHVEGPPALQVFACDLDGAAIQLARAGHYPDVIATDVSEERLQRFFVKDHHGYQVRRELREMVLFATHDLLKDPPFSRMDLISCRNLLIYLAREAQEWAFNTFHFALKPGGLLFLGASEAVDDSSVLFKVLDKKHRIYVHQPAARTGFPIPTGPTSLLPQPLPGVHGKQFTLESLPQTPDKFAGKLKLDRAGLADLHFRLLESIAPPSVIVNADHEVMHLSEHAGAFLKLSGGEPTANLLRLVHPMLRVELRAALFRAAESQAPVDCIDVPLEVDGQTTSVTIHVAPAQDVTPGYLLVVFEHEDRSTASPAAQTTRATPNEPVVQHLERELEQVKRRLRDTVAQYETSTEELKASNEDLQAMNEELRSATEELETGREELQSINEELTTVNQEMKIKVDELACANSDLQNLMASTSIATVFLDRDQTITRFTPSAAGLFNLIPGDVGRPLAHLRHRLDYPELLGDAKKVLQTLVPVEREVRGGGQWFFARLQPYRTSEDHIAGSVLTLVDITERNRATEALRESEERLRLLIESAKDHAILTTDHDRRINSWNNGAEAMCGYAATEIIGQPVDVLFTPEDQAKSEPERAIRLAREEGRAATERWHTRKNGTLFYGSGSVMPLLDNAGVLRGFVNIIRDLTEHKRTQEALREHMDELMRFNAAATGREMRMIELKKEINELCARVGEGPRYALEFEREERRNTGA
jgi:two-component system CheB/CheR fusion protein